MTIISGISGQGLAWSLIAQGQDSLVFVYSPASPEPEPEPVKSSDARLPRNNACLASQEACQQDIQTLTSYVIRTQGQVSGDSKFKFIFIIELSGQSKAKTSGDKRNLVLKWDFKQINPPDKHETNKKCQKWCWMCFNNLLPHLKCSEHLLR